MFNRDSYYSITQIRNKFQISNRKLQEAITANQIPVVTKDINLGEYAVKAQYYVKKHIDDLALPIKQK